MSEGLNVAGVRLMNGLQRGICLGSNVAGVRLINGLQRDICHRLNVAGVRLIHGLQRGIFLLAQLYLAAAGRRAGGVRTPQV